MLLLQKLFQIALENQLRPKEYRFGFRPVTVKKIAGQPFDSQTSLLDRIFGDQAEQLALPQGLRAFVAKVAAHSKHPALKPQGADCFGQHQRASKIDGEQPANVRV